MFQNWYFPFLFGADPTNEFKRFKIQINSDKESLEKFKQVSLGSGEQKTYKRREGIQKKAFRDFLKNFQEQIPGSVQFVKTLYKVNLDKELPFEREFNFLQSENIGKVAMIFLTNDKNKNINITYIQYEVIAVPQNVPSPRSLPNLDTNPNPPRSIEPSPSTVLGDRGNVHINSGQINGSSENLSTGANIEVTVIQEMAGNMQKEELRYVYCTCLLYTSPSPRDS